MTQLKKETCQSTCGGHEKAKSSHFDRTRGDKKQIFFTLILDTLGKRSEKLTALLFFDFEHHLFQKNIEHYSKLQ